MTKILIAILIGISVPVLLVGAQEAYAAHVNLDDRTENQITITASQFEHGTSGTGTSAGEIKNFQGTWTVRGAGIPDPGRGFVYIVDECTGNVSDIITARWRSTIIFGFGIATIDIRIQSSPAGADLGPLPAGFTGNPEGIFLLNGKFEDSNGNPVRIPSNLTIQFLGVQEECAVDVDIDVKPGSFPSSVNCKNTKGSVPVAIFGSADFDATTIDIEIVSMSLVSATPITVTEVHEKLHIEDLNEDGFDDAVLHLDKEQVCTATDPLTGEGTVELTGSNAEVDFVGTGDINIVKR